MNSLAPEWRIGDLNLTDWPFAVPFGADYGTPDASPEALSSFLTDGDLELTTRRGNRTLTLPVWIEETDLAAAAAAEALLVEECDKPLNTLYVDPGDGFGEPFQFTVFRGQVTFQRDDDHESNTFRMFQVVWRALPWPESDTEIEAALTASTVGSAKQRIGTFAVAGSVASRGSLSLQHATAGLGQVLVYTCPDDNADYVPACRSYETIGSPISDSDRVSGFRNELAPSGSLIYVVPAANLTDGEHVIVARARCTDSAPGAEADTRFRALHQIDSNQVSPTTEGRPIGINFSDGYQFYRLGVIHFPLVDSPVSGLSSLKLFIDNLDATQTVAIDEVYLFNLSIGRLSQFDCGTGTPDAGLVNNRLWVDSPSVENDGLGRYVMGTQTDRSDAYSALDPFVSVAARPTFPSVHEFPAAGVSVFTVTSGPSTAVATTYRYRPAGHSSVYTGE